MITSRNVNRIALLRWSARIASAGLALLLLTFFVGESLAGDGPDLSHLSDAETLEFIAMAGMLAGGLLGFWREAAGGWLCLFAGMLFNAVESWSGGGLDLFWFSTVYMVIGLAYLLAQAGSSHRRAGRS